MWRNKKKFCENEKFVFVDKSYTFNKHLTCEIIKL